MAARVLWWGKRDFAFLGRPSSLTVSRVGSACAEWSADRLSGSGGGAERRRDELEVLRGPVGRPWPAMLLDA